MRNNFKFLMLVVLAFGFSFKAHAEDDPMMADFFCGADRGANNGFVEASDQTCPDGQMAAKTDHECESIFKKAKIHCSFSAHCFPMTPDIKKLVEGALNDDERYKKILASHMFDHTPLPISEVSCRVKADPCAPSCPSLHDCADPKKGGSNRFLRLLPVDPLEEHAFQRDGKGRVLPFGLPTTGTTI